MKKYILVIVISILTLATGYQTYQHHNLKSLVNSNYVELRRTADFNYSVTYRILYPANSDKGREHRVLPVCRNFKINDWDFNDCKGFKQRTKEEEIEYQKLLSKLNEKRLKQIRRLNDERLLRDKKNDERLWKRIIHLNNIIPRRDKK